jgi:ferric-dicitrate binding protein FerR (iron transport regulator)
MFSRQFLHAFMVAAMLAAVCAGAAWSAETKLSAADKRVIDALRSTTNIEFFEESLQDVVDYLKKYHKVDIRFDEKALGDAGVKTDVPVTRRMGAVTLHSALRLILIQLDLAHVVRDGAILITTPERGRQLVRDGGIDPAGFCQRPAARQKIAAALKKPVRMEFVDESLANVIDYLIDYCRVEIQIDHRALTRARVRMDVPRTINIREVPLETALRLLLRDLGLTCVAEDEWILITAAKDEST